MSDKDLETVLLHFTFREVATNTIYLQEALRDTNVRAYTISPGVGKNRHGYCRHFS